MMRGFQRAAVPEVMRPKARPAPFVSPTRGWVTNENLAAARGASARLIENWFPEVDGIRLRAGAAKNATIGATAVEALFTYAGGGSEMLFAADATKIFDVSALDPDTAPAADVSGQTSGHYSVENFATAGGDFLYACNEADAPQLFDGTSWTQITGISSPAITGVTTSLLKSVWSYRDRLFFVERDSLRAWYLPVESIGGAASDIELAGVFGRGGSLLFGATWSLDAGDGVDDKCVFVTDKGEVAIYEGADPSDINDWRLVGRYDISEPLGKNGHMRAGGDVLIATLDGIVPLTEIIQKDPAALSLSAVTRPIEPDWTTEARAALDAYPWEMLKWPLRNMGIVSLPHSTLSTPRCLVVNLQSGAWAKYVGWDVRSMAVFGRQAYFGDSAGNILAMESGGTDNGSSYLCRVSFAFSHLKAPGAHKTAQLARAIFIAASAFTPKLSVTTDYAITFPTPPSAAADGGADAVWDAGVWDVSKWDDAGEGGLPMTVTTRWVSVDSAGFAMAPQIQVTVGNNRPPNAKLVTFDLMYETGGMVV